MKTLLLLLLATLVPVAPLVAADAPALTPKPLPAIKAAIEIPADWFVKEDKEDDVIIYQFSHEKPADGAMVTGLILTVTPKITERTEMKPSQYAVEMLTATLDDDTTKIVPTKDGPIETARAEHLIESETGAVKMVNVSKANDTTGTLYFLTWQAPLADEEKVRDLREKIFASLTLDPAQ